MVITTNIIVIYAVVASIISSTMIERKESPNFAASASQSLRSSEMAGHKVAHATLKGPSVVKEIIIGAVLGLAAGGLWKMHHWNEQRKVRTFYDLLEKGEISVVAEE
ncbi:hypothetical protein ACLB2K_046272 [Fragaria x ananassa]